MSKIITRFAPSPTGHLHIGRQIHWGRQLETILFHTAYNETFQIQLRRNTQKQIHI